MQLLKAKTLKAGDTIGIFTPSSPAYQDNEALFLNGIKNLSSLGFNVKLGSLTARRASQGYRSATPQERAQEFMELIQDPSVHGLMSTIGGNNSNSLIPFLDFEAIRKSQKVICGYSDITSLHMSILHYAGLRTFYGPALMTWFGEFPSGVSESTESFLEAVSQHQRGTRRLQPFKRWSNHRRSWATDELWTLPRLWQENRGPLCLNPGEVSAPVVVANLNTLISAAGTPYFPNVEAKILLLESMAAPFNTEERSLRQLQLMGVFDRIAGLIFGKPEFPDTLKAPFSHNDLIQEIVGKRPYPIISEFDCSHTNPMYTLAQMTPIKLSTQDRGNYGETQVEILEPMVEAD